MQMNKIDYHFKVRNAKDVALNLGVIYRNLGYSKINKAEITKIYNICEQDIVNDYCLNDVVCRVENAHFQQKDRLDNMCKQLKCKWVDYQAKYFKILSEVFDIELNNAEINHIYCYLHLLPINEVDLLDNIIYLNANQSIDEVFKSFIIMLTKALLLRRWNSVNDWDFNTEFDYKNKIWMFAELAIDPIFACSELSDITNKPSYKYFYDINIEGENIMQKFRDMYNRLPLDEFFTEVYMFVHNNYQTLLQFKNYLY